MATKLIAPMHPNDIFSAADRARIVAALDAAGDTVAYNDADLTNFPARAWGDLLEALRLGDLAARARAELAQMSGVAESVFTWIRRGLDSGEASAANAA